jgi:hypothetical protein
MVADLVRWFFGAFNKLYYDKLFLAYSDGGARMAARLWLMLVSIVVARWPKYPFVFLLLFELFVLM